jgi:lysophospholipase L1-like esterase
MKSWKFLIMFFALSIMAMPGFSQQGNQSIPSGGGGITNVPSLNIVSAGLLADYQANAGDIIASLKDYSGNGNNAIGTVGTAPTIAAGGGGGISCPGNGAIILPALNSAQTIQLFISYQSNSNSNAFNAPIAGNGNGTVNNAIQFALYTGSTGAYPTSQPGAPRLISFSNNAQKEQALNIFNGNDVLSFVMAPATNDVFYQGTNVLVNPIGTGVSSGLQTAGAYQLCGSAAGSGNTNQTYFTGTIVRALFYSTTLTAGQIAQNVQVMRENAVSRGYPVFQYSTSSKNVVAVLGDSIGVTNGLTSSWPAQLALFDTYDIVNQSISGTTTCGQIPQAAQWIDTVYRPNATRNVVILATGTNDVFVSLPNYLGVLQCVRQFVQARKLVGWKVLLTTILDRGGGSTQKNAWNQIVRQFWTVVGADGLIDFAGNVNLGADGANANGTYFQDTTHPTQTGINLMAPIASFGVNRLFANTLNAGVANTAKNEAIGSFIQTTNCNNTSTAQTTWTLTYVNANYPGNLLTLHARNNPTSVTDSNGNTWTQRLTNGGGGYWDAIGVSGGEPNTVTITYSSANFCQIVIAEYGGVQNAAPEASAANSGTSTSLSSGNFTTLTASDLIVGGGFNDTSNGPGYTAGATYTIRGSSAQNTFLEDVVFVGPGATSTTATSGSSVTWHMFGAAYKTAVNSTYNMLATDTVLYCDPSAGNQTVNLPDAINVVGTVTIKNVQTAGANTCTVAGINSETIDGSASVVVANKATLVVKSKLVSPSAAGVNWVQLQNN